VEDMGFGRVLYLQLENVPTALAFWLVENYDHQTATLNMGNIIISVTTTLINEVLGIPIGKTPVVDRRTHVKCEAVNEWREQFGVTDWAKRPYVLGFF